MSPAGFWSLHPVTLQGWPLLSSSLQRPGTEWPCEGPQAPPEAPGDGTAGLASTRGDLPPRQSSTVSSDAADSSGRASSDDVSESTDPGLSEPQPSGCSTVTCWVACVKVKGTENSGRNYLNLILSAKFHSSPDLDPALAGPWQPLGMQTAGAQQAGGRSQTWGQPGWSGAKGGAWEAQLSGRAPEEKAGAGQAGHRRRARRHPVSGRQAGSPEKNFIY